MDYWLDAPLCKAHFYDRRANALVKKACFDEAIECHLIAAKLLSDSIKVTDNDKALESIKLQKEYHLKQKEVLWRKKLEYQALKKVIRIQQEAAVTRMLKAKEAAGKYSATDELSLQKAIYRTIDEADSLLGILFTKEDLVTDAEGNKENPSGGETLVVNGRINPKDDKTVIEELRVVNCQLRTLVSELMSKLIASENEVQTLKQRVAELEAENSSLQPRFVSASDYSSPFVFSPEDELTPAVPPELPALAPLEMPNFDMSVLHKKYQSSKQQD